MKLLKRVSILAVLITVIAVFAGCGKEATVVGTWEGDDYTYTFNDDGTGIPADRRDKRFNYFV